MRKGKGGEAGEAGERVAKGTVVGGTGGGERAAVPWTMQKEKTLLMHLTGH